MNDQHQYAEQKYNLLRQESLSAALLSLPATLRENIVLTNINSATLASRTALCGPACRVVWQGSINNVDRPYADFSAN